MIRLDYNTKVQELWIPRSSTGSGDVRKTYKDGYKDGFDEGLRSSKIKLYDGMKLGYSKIYNLDNFDFSSVRNGEHLFSNCTFYNYDVYDFREINSHLSKQNYFIEGTYFYGNSATYPSVYVTIKENDISPFLYGCRNCVLFVDVDEAISSLFELFNGNKATETHLNSTQSIISFNGIFGNNYCPVFHLSNFDMSKEKYPSDKIFTIYGAVTETITDFYMDADTVPTSTMERLQNALVKETSFYKNTVFHYGKERWTWDSENNEWAITGYDE